MKFTLSLMVAQRNKAAVLRASFSLLIQNPCMVSSFFIVIKCQEIQEGFEREVDEMSLEVPSLKQPRAVYDIIFCIKYVYNIKTLYFCPRFS